MQEIANVFDYTVVECTYDCKIFDYKKGHLQIWPKDMEIPKGWVEVPTDIAYKFMQEFNAAC